MPRALRVLGIGVGEDLLARWRGWLLPDEQPYVVPRAVAADLGLSDEPERLTMELKDSFWLYATGEDAVVWLSRTGARRLPAGVRADQPAPHRWPSRDPVRDTGRVVRFVEEGRRPAGAAWMSASTTACVKAPAVAATPITAVGSSSRIAATKSVCGACSWA